MPFAAGHTPNYLHLLLYFCLSTGEQFSNRACKPHSSPASAANASGFLQISLSQMLRRDTLVPTRLQRAGALAIGNYDLDEAAGAADATACLSFSNGEEERVDTLQLSNVVDNVQPSLRLQKK